jgi:hypothetical protein
VEEDNFTLRGKERERERERERGNGEKRGRQVFSSLSEKKARDACFASAVYVKLSSLDSSSNQS